MSKLTSKRRIRQAIKHIEPDPRPDRYGRHGFDRITAKA